MYWTRILQIGLWAWEDSNYWNMEKDGRGISDFKIPLDVLQNKPSSIPPDISNRTCACACTRYLARISPTLAQVQFSFSWHAGGQMMTVVFECVHNSPSLPEYLSCAPLRFRCGLRSFKACPHLWLYHVQIWAHQAHFYFLRRTHSLHRAQPKFNRWPRSPHLWG
jgi:hypothetical protein